MSEQTKSAQTESETPDAYTATTSEFLRLEACAKDAERWNTLPAFLEKYQINYVALLRDIDATIKEKK